MIQDREKNSVDYFPNWSGEVWNTLHHQAQKKTATSYGESKNVLRKDLNVGAVLSELDIILDEKL